MTSSRYLLLALLACTLLPAQDLKPFEAVEPHMGTLFRIKLYAPDADTAQRAFKSAFARVAELDATLSDYQPDSELNRLPKIAVGHPASVSEDLFRVLAASQHISEQTGGAFDITVGPITHLWRTARKEHRLPTEAETSAAREHSGFRKLHLDPANRTAQLDEPGMQLDAGGIAKGDAADQALAVLTRSGIRSALVAASGDLAFSDAPPGQSGWSIGIDSLDQASAAFTRILHLHNAAVSTSGPEEQNLQLNGIRYSHIVDPRTALGLTADLTVTVVARSGIEADPTATAVSVLGPEKGLAYLNTLADTSGILVTRTASGKMESFESKHFAILKAAQ